MTEESDIPYEERELIQRAINGACGRHAAAVVRDERRPYPRWRIVKELFCCGSTVANLICCRYGYDPQDVVGEAAKLAEDGSPVFIDPVDSAGNSAPWRGR